jgi:hypothetical protein
MTLTRMRRERRRRRGRMRRRRRRRRRRLTGKPGGFFLEVGGYRTNQLRLR